MSINDRLLDAEIAQRRERGIYPCALYLGLSEFNELRMWLMQYCSQSESIARNGKRMEWNEHPVFRVDADHHIGFSALPIS